MNCASLTSTLAAAAVGDPDNKNKKLEAVPEKKEEEKPEGEKQGLEQPLWQEKPQNPLHRRQRHVGDHPGESKTTRGQRPEELGVFGSGRALGASVLVGDRQNDVFGGKDAASPHVTSKTKLGVFPG